jgi:hypothetical protein
MAVQLTPFLYFYPMQRLIILFIAILAAGTSYGQSLKKYPISNSGCSAYFFCDPGTISLEKSPDSSDVYTGECSNDEVFYGIIVVKLKDKITDMQASEDVLIAYLDYLKTSLKITSAAGYGKGHKLKNREDTRGVIDYWKDNDSENWKVKGWTNGKYIVVLYAYTKKDLPEQKVNVFLDGLVLPGM